MGCSMGDPTGIGSGYVVRDKREPLVTITNFGITFKVCVRKRGEEWKEVIADFKYRKDAELFIEQLKIEWMKK